MKLEGRVLAKSENEYEPCRSIEKFTLYVVPPATGKTDENSIMLCDE